MLSLIFLKKLKDQLYIMPIRFGLKISIYLMILSFEKLHKMVASYALLFAMRLIEEIYFVKYHNFFVLSYLSKSFEKATELQDKDRKSRRRFINSLAELSDKSVSTMITWIFPTTVLFIFLFYEFTAYSMIKVHYLYFFLFTVFFIPIEPFLLLLANYIRTLQDKHYFCPEIHELSNNNFRERQTS